MTELLVHKDWHDSTKIADACYYAQNETGRFIGTAFTARDVMRIVDALDGDGMLNYWGTFAGAARQSYSRIVGLSYGTVLGATIAAMFPDRIRRMYLDSVVNPLDYMAG